MAQQPPELAVHETMQIHEILNFKTVCLLKSKLMQGMVQDKELKDLLRKDMEQSALAIAELQALYPKSQLQ